MATQQKIGNVVITVTGDGDRHGEHDGRHVGAVDINLVRIDQQSWSARLGVGYAREAPAGTASATERRLGTASRGVSVASERRSGRAPTMDHTVADRMGEHEEMNELLAEKRSLAPDGFAFAKRGSAFLLEVEGHFQREESVLARMRASFTTDELAELGSQALGVKQQLPGASRRRAAPRH